MPASILPAGVSWLSSENCLRWTFELLYEQCSLHMTEYIASSELVGRRPRISRMFAYSSGLRPRSAHGCARSAVLVASSTVSRLGRCSVNADGSQIDQRATTGPIYRPPISL